MVSTYISLKALNSGSLQYKTLRYITFHTQAEFCLVCSDMTVLSFKWNYNYSLYKITLHSVKMWAQNNARSSALVWWRVTLHSFLPSRFFLHLLINTYRQQPLLKLKHFTPLNTFLSPKILIEYINSQIHFSCPSLLPPNKTLRLYFFYSEIRAEN